jgi:DNA-binding transcriptional ArsR family regulator
MVNAGRAEYAETAPEGYEDDPVSVRREADALRQEVEALEGRADRKEAVEVYAALDGEYVTVESLAETVETDEPAVYEALQALMEEGLVEYDTMRNAYRSAE